jgi:importin-7
MASKITYRLFCRYGNPDTTMGTKLEQFGQYFQSKFNQQFLGRHLTMMLERKSSFVGTKCLNFNMRYVCYAIKIKPLMAVLKPYIDNILYETAIPIMLPSQRDVALFHEDPIEYIRKQEDITETLYMPKNTLIDLIQYICKYKSNKKGKQDYLIPFLTYAKQNMEQY